MTKRNYRKYKLLRFYQEDLWGRLSTLFLSSINKYNSGINNSNSKENFLKIKRIKINDKFFFENILFLHEKQKLKKEKFKTKFPLLKTFIKKRFAYRSDLGAPFKNKRKLSLFGLRLKNRRKLMGFCNAMNVKQFRSYVLFSHKKKSMFGFFFKLLESRLDLFLYRINFGETPSLIRQLINHGNFIVNGKMVNHHSFQLKNFDVVSVKNKDFFFNLILKFLVQKKIFITVPSYIEVNYRILSAILYTNPLIIQIPYSFYTSSFLFTKFRNKGFFQETNCNINKVRSVISGFRFKN